MYFEKANHNYGTLNEMKMKTIRHNENLLRAVYYLSHVYDKHDISELFEMSLPAAEEIILEAGGPLYPVGISGLMRSYVERIADSIRNGNLEVSQFLEQLDFYEKRPESEICGNNEQDFKRDAAFIVSSMLENSIRTIELIDGRVVCLYINNKSTSWFTNLTRLDSELKAVDYWEYKDAAADTIKRCVNAGINYFSTPRGSVELKTFDSKIDVVLNNMAFPKLMVPTTCREYAVV